MEVSLHRLHDTHLRNASLKGAYSSEMMPYARPIRACPMNRSYSRWRGMKPSIASLAFSAVLLTPLAAFAKGEILFIRGADRSGGFMEAKDDSKRTSQLGDINDKTSNQRNHGWATFAATLRKAGFKVTQITEPLEAGAPQAGQTAGAPVALETMDLTKVDVIIFGSNNAAYGKPAVDAVESYLRGGGGAIFISDANFGGHWADASNSDQPFLDRLGLVANQDMGTYVLYRDKGDFVRPDHPILKGVNAFDGEGVTPVTVSKKLAKGVSVEILAHPKGMVRRNDMPDKAGSKTMATKQDAVLAAGTIDKGRFIWHFDRNTFFNKGGAGSDITRHDNAVLAVNLMNWVAKVD